jgi:hypothetical protein
MIFIYTINCTIRLPLYKYYFPLFCDCCSIILLLVSTTLQLTISCCFINLLNHRIHWSWKFVLEMKLKIMCYIYFEVLYPKYLIASLTRVDSFKLIMHLCLLLKNSKWITKDFFKQLTSSKHVNQSNQINQANISQVNHVNHVIIVNN